MQRPQGFETMCSLKSLTVSVLLDFDTFGVNVCIGVRWEMDFILHLCPAAAAPMLGSLRDGIDDIAENQLPTNILPILTQALLP